MAFKDIFKKRKFWTISTISAAFLACAIIVPVVIVPSYLKYQEYYNNMKSDLEHQKYLNSLPLELKGISATLAEDVYFYANGRATPSNEDFDVVAHFTEKGKDFDEKLQPSDFSIAAPEDFSLKGGVVNISYTYTYPKEDDTDESEPKQETKTAEVNCSLTEVRLAKLEVVENPYKIVYAENDVFDPEGMTLSATYNDGTAVKISYLDITSDKAPLALGKTSETLTYTDGKSEISLDFPINVKSKEEYAKEVSDSNIVSLSSAKGISLTEGSELTKAKPVIRAKYKNGNNLIIADSLYSLTGNIDKASFMKNCILTVTLNSNSTITARLPIEVKNSLEAEDSNVATLVGGEKKVDVSDFELNGGLLVDSGTKVTAIEKPNSISFNMNSQRVAKTNLSLRIANRSISEDKKSIQSLKLSDVMSIKVNGRMFPSYASTILPGYGNSEEDTQKYVFEEVKLPDVALNKGDNKIDFTFDYSKVGNLGSVAVDSLVFSTSYEGEFYSDLDELLLSGESIGASSEVTKIVDFGNGNQAGVYGHAIANDGKYLYTTFTNYANPGIKRTMSVAKIDPATGAVIAKSARTVADFQEASAGILAYGGKLIVFGESGKRYSTNIADFKEGAAFVEDDSLNFEGLEGQIIKDVYYNSERKEFAVMYGSSNISIFDENLKQIKKLSLPSSFNGGEIRRMSGNNRHIFVNYRDDGLYMPSLVIFDWEGNNVGKAIVPNSSEVMGSVVTNLSHTNVQGITCLNGEMYFSVLKWGNENGGDATAFIKLKLDDVKEDRALNLNFGEYLASCEDMGGKNPVFNISPTTGTVGKIGKDAGWAMGGISDGEYIYLSMNIGGNGKSAIYKVNPLDYSTIATSKTFSTGKGSGDNSRMFIKNDTIYVIGLENKLFSLPTNSFTNGVDFKEDNSQVFKKVIDSLAGKGTIKSAYWSDTTAQYVVMDSIGKMYLLDEQGNIKKTVALKSHGSMKASSLTGDDKYIYVSYSQNEQKNIPFDTYTWDGEYIASGTPTGVSFGGYSEYNIQSIFFHNGEMYYVLCTWNNSASGMYLWKVSVDNSILDRQLKSIEVASNPTKTVYKSGEEFDPAGMVVKGVYEDGNGIQKKVEITDYIYSPHALSNTTDNDIKQDITITYYDGKLKFETKVTVTVKSSLSIGDYIKTSTAEGKTPSFKVNPSQGTDGKILPSVGYSMGGVSDGEYIYLSQNTGGKNGNKYSYIHKIKADTYELVADSANYETGVGDGSGDNSRLFIKDGKLFSISKNGVIYSIALTDFNNGAILNIDNSLPLSDVLAQYKDIQSIKFDGKAKRYYVLGGGTVYILDEQGNITKSINVGNNKPKGFEGQYSSSLEIDGKYLYVSHKMNNQKSVLILVYDLEGNYVGYGAPEGIKLDKGQFNVQSIFIHNGIMYATLCTWDGAPAGFYLWSISTGE